MITLIYKVILFFIFIACVTTPALFKDGDTLAVWDFDDLSPPAFTQPDLGSLLSSQVIKTAEEKTKLNVIEREELLHVLRELRMGTTGLVDEHSRLNMGKIAGARFMIFGGYQIISDRMRLDIRLVEVETGRIMRAAQKTSSSEDTAVWLQIAQDAAEQLLKP
jgi:curli biogenesis system outer membrane secretion channel CsgG